MYNGIYVMFNSKQTPLQSYFQSRGEVPSLIKILTLTIYWSISLFLLIPPVIHNTKFRLHKFLLSYLRSLFGHCWPAVRVAGQKLSLFAKRMHGFNWQLNAYTTRNCAFRQNNLRSTIVRTCSAWAEIYMDLFGDTACYCQMDMLIRI